MPVRWLALTRLSASQKIALIVTVALAAALLAGAWIWARAPDYRILFTQLSDRDGGAVLAALQQMNVPYKLGEGGAIMVPAAQVHEVRLKLASQGLPKGGVLGFELLENPKLGASQFQEQVNYQRALEGELARTVQSIASVESARVHLAMPRPSVFLRERQKPSASVLVHLYPGRTLDEAQVNAIVHLVSSSVPELAPRNVTVIDQRGNLLSANAEPLSASGLDSVQIKYRNHLESLYARRIEAILTPIVGAPNLRAQVSAEVDFSHVEQTAETYRPNAMPGQAAVRSQHMTESTGDGLVPTGGIPGALSNQPPPPVTAPLEPQSGKKESAGPSPASAAAPSRKESTTNYEVDKTVTYTRQASGSVRRLSAAVVVNYRAVVGANGRMEMKPLSPEELAQITNLVKEAIGFDEKRGDTVNVVNSPFTVPEEAPAPQLPFWKQPEILSLAKDLGKHLLLALLAAYLLFGVLRPLLQNLLAAGTTGRPLAVEDSVPELAAPPSPQASSLEAARQLARQDPKVVANVVKSWVGGDEG
ncbi:flagellar basal-body MS-ring/collar protein FliF [Pelomicrobium sp. G1]|uniref:flagellar basal-body MS-ring/collar protein FliF n=1 Tax=unclassified Pelomicrobium TaxID=2815318 RepID=UPI003F75A936